MLNINHVIVTGNLTNDVVHHGNGFMTGTVAVNNSYKKDGEWINKTAFLKFTLNRKEEYVENLLNVLKKGTHVCIEGSIYQEDKYVGADGQERYGQIGIKASRINKTIPDNLGRPAGEPEAPVTDFDNIEV